MNLLPLRGQQARRRLLTQLPRTTSAAASGERRMTATAPAGIPVFCAMLAMEAPARASFRSSRWACAIMSLYYHTLCDESRLFWGALERRGAARRILTVQPRRRRPDRPAVVGSQNSRKFKFEKYRFSTCGGRQFSCQVGAKTPLGGTHYMVVTKIVTLHMVESFSDFQQ
jgi:hypothetical protein